MKDPLEQDEWSTLEAELRRAEQHRSAAYERMRETQREVEALVERARELTERLRREEGAEQPPAS